MPPHHVKAPGPRGGGGLGGGTGPIQKKISVLLTRPEMGNIFFVIFEFIILIFFSKELN